MNTKVISKYNMLIGMGVFLSVFLIQDKAYCTGGEVPALAPSTVNLNSMPLDNAKEVSALLSQGINVSPSIDQIMSMVDLQTLESVFPDGLTTYLEQDFTDMVPKELIGVDISSFEPIKIVQNGVETIVGYIKEGEIIRSFF